MTVNCRPAIDTLPVRDVDPVYSEMDSVTVPRPDPVAPPVTAIQVAVDVAVQLQPSPVETLTDTLDGSVPTATLLLDSIVVHELPACETVNERPAIVSVPILANGDVFADAVYWTVPLPVPDPDVTVSQAVLLVAVQAHVASLVTLTDSLVALDPMLIEVGLRLNVQATPVCVMASVSLPTLSVPVRVAVDVFGATL